MVGVGISQHALCSSLGLEVQYMRDRCRSGGLDAAARRSRIEGGGHRRVRAMEWPARRGKVCWGGAGVGSYQLHGNGEVVLEMRAKLGGARLGTRKAARLPHLIRSHCTHGLVVLVDRSSSIERATGGLACY